MNIRPITITEFRKNTKVILDNTTNEPIYLNRRFEVFKLERVGEGGLSIPPSPAQTKVPRPHEPNEVIVIPFTE